MPDPIVAEELELLEKVSHRIAEMDDPISADEAPIVEELKSIREQQPDLFGNKLSGRLGVGVTANSLRGVSPSIVGLPFPPQAMPTSTTVAAPIPKAMR